MTKTIGATGMTMPSRGGIAVCLASGPITTLALAGPIPILPAMAAEFAQVPNGETLVRGVLTTVSLASIVGAPLAALVAERLGLRRVLVAALGLSGVAGAACGLVDDLYTLLALRFLVGLANAAIGTIAIALIALWFTRSDRDYWLGRLTFVATVVGFLLIPVAGALGELNWRAIFWLHAISLLFIPLALLGIRSDLGSETPPDGAADAAAPAIPSVRAGALIAMGLAFGVVVSSPSLFLPFHLADIGSGSPAEVAAALLPVPITMAVSSFFYGRLRSRFSMAALLVPGMALAACAYTIDAMAGSLWQVIAGQTLLGLAIGMLMPLLYGWAAAAGPDATRTRRVGIVRGSFFAGLPVAQFLLEPFAGWAGAAGALYAVAALALAVAASGLAWRTAPSAADLAN